ncbi:hypothetical protein NAEGRDRAFT_32902 [Naegleria gruberi]|uniref:Actin n=1 Tax=Naegleria gruberi TaxID=5762 RepID=D2VC45_NAEGR|nr:uncharacterized protein NAEGRDRAFT_32902 [Naegleria gruberi]EFC45593.1 hypothetical protein NAEGRDRAFT_32902 [Naegleria gruberi]|eukprot:XP_002678337.1 hypothetical protein NAEGRDRAFT_32902 [Naegleria gruberi strain NEG-M]
MSFEGLASVIIDNGSHTMKAGFSGDYQPKECFPTIVWRQTGMIGLGDTPIAVGERASGYRRDSLRFPIRRGKIVDWDDMEVIWRRIFTHYLAADMETTPALLTESPSKNSKEDREKMIQVLFDAMELPSVYIANQAVTTLFGCDKVNGLVLESGHGSSHTVPVYEGYALSHATESLDLGGLDVTEYLKRKVDERNESKLSFGIVEDIKEKHCYILMDCEKSRENEKVSYELPDETVILLGDELYEASECLFNPSLIDFNCKGIHENIIPLIEKCDQDIRNELYRNIVLGGGNTLLKGFRNRIEKECNKISPIEVSICETNHAQFSSWKGASILAQTSQFIDLSISRKDYQEYGSKIVHRKFF